MKKLISTSKYIVFISLSLFFYSCDLNHILKDKEAKYKMSADIEITENANSDTFSIKSKLYNNNNKIITAPKKIAVNNIMMEVSSSYKGFYMREHYYFISSYKNEDFFKDTNNFIFSIENGNNFVKLKTIKKYKAINKNDLTFIKKEDGLKIKWNNLKGFNNLRVTISAKHKNKQGSFLGKEIHTSKIKTNGSYEVYYKNMSYDKKDLLSFTFHFSGLEIIKLDSLKKGSNVSYNREYYKTIYLKNKSLK